jgi:hypothetical protein
VTLEITPRHRQGGLVSALARLARQFFTETNVSPVFFEVNSRSGRNTLSDLG